MLGAACCLVELGWPSVAEDNDIMFEVHMLQFHENSSFHSKKCMPFIWNKKDFFLIVLQLYDVIFSLNAK